MKIDPTKNKWTHPLPIWVSREDADGTISEFSVPVWCFMLIGALSLLNVIAWGIIGLVEVVQYIL